MASKHSKLIGFEEKSKLEDKDLITSPEEQKKKIEEQAAEANDADQAEKQNASERINLQHIMELREAFDIADTREER